MAKTFAAPPAQMATRLAKAAVKTPAIATADT
jgi:hypothetical protein